jgi:hypothetical protein
MKFSLSILIFMGLWATGSCADPNEKFLGDLKAVLFTGFFDVPVDADMTNDEKTKEAEGKKIKKSFREIVRSEITDLLAVKIMFAFDFHFLSKVDCPI